MTISEQVAELEKQAQAAADRGEYYRNGLRAGLRGDMMTETDPDGVMDRGWREGDRLRRLVRMDLEGFRAGVLGETFGDGSDPAFVAGYHEGEKVREEIVRKAESRLAVTEDQAQRRERLRATLNIALGNEGQVAFSDDDLVSKVQALVAARMASDEIDAANRRALTAALGVVWTRGRSVEEGIRRLAGLREEVGQGRVAAVPTSTPDGHYLIRNVPGYTRPVHVKVAGGNVWGYSVYAGVAGYRTLGRAVVGWAKPEMRWEEEKALPVGPVRSVQPCPICHRQMFVHPDSVLFLDGDGPHTCEAVKPDPTPRIGGDPPEPEIGMVYTFGGWANMVCGAPFTWPSDLLEVRAPWGGPAIWRRGGAE